MREFGIFNDEGLIVGQFYTRKKAETFLLETYTTDDELSVYEVCEEHPENAHITCEECNAKE